MAKTLKFHFVRPSLTEVMTVLLLAGGAIAGLTALNYGITLSVHANLQHSVGMSDASTPSAG